MLAIYRMHEEGSDDLHVVAVSMAAAVRAWAHSKSYDVDCEPDAVYVVAEHGDVVIGEGEKEE